MTTAFTPSKTTLNYAKRRGLELVLDEDGTLAFYEASEDMEPLFAYAASEQGFFYKANVYLAAAIKEELPRWIATDADLRRVIDFVAQATAVKASQQDYRLAIGCTVTVIGYDGQWCLADIAQDRGDAIYVLRSLEPRSASRLAGYYGTEPITPRDRYDWLNQRDTHKMHVLHNAAPAPGIVRQITLASDTHGTCFSATITGQSEPVAALHLATVHAFLKHLAEQALIVSPHIAVQLEAPHRHLAPGPYPLSVVLKAERDAANEIGDTPSL